MTDYISREDALNFEMEIEADPEDIQAISKGMALYGEYIKSIPTADVVERKRGKWIPSKEPPWLDCSECGQDSVEYTNFCPNCGADMREANDEKA